MSAVLERPARATARACGVVELRQYTLHPGRRETLIELFEREFVDPQEACGMQVLGSFRDLDAPDRFTWLRGFPDMPARAQALADFYGGPVWQAHRETANATMIDSDHVHLLRPVGSFLPPPRRRVDDDASVLTATLYPIRRGGEATFTAFFHHAMQPLLWNASVEVAACFVTEAAANTYPALPVREHDPVFAWLGRHASAERAAQAMARVEEALDWSPAIADALHAHLRQAPQQLRLSPTARSRLRG